MTTYNQENSLLESKYCIIQTTTDDEKVASSISHELVSKKLAACVQMDQVVSTFYWNDKVQSTKEFRLIIKTRTTLYDAIKNLIISIHNYKLPEVIVVDIIAGSKDYLDWIDSNTKSLN